MTTLAIPQPTSLVEVETRCDQIDAFWPQCETVAHVQEGQAILAAWDEYLARTSKDGRARVAASMRRGEIRIGELLGPPKAPQETGSSKGSGATEPLSKDERYEFRQMAQNPDLVEDVIAESTDEQPASRRKVTKRINEVSRARMDRAKKAMGAESDPEAERTQREKQARYIFLVNVMDTIRAMPSPEEVATEIDPHLGERIFTTSLPIVVGWLTDFSSAWEEKRRSTFGASSGGDNNLTQGAHTHGNSNIEEP